MVADLFHRGHLELLKKCKALAGSGTLVVGIHSDETVVGYKRLPVIPMGDRVEILNAVRFVDEVLPDVPLKVTGRFIEEHKIDVVVHGDDMDGFEDDFAIPIKLGIMKTFPYYGGESTSAIIDRIVRRSNA